MKHWHAANKNIGCYRAFIMASYMTQTQNNIQTLSMVSILVRKVVTKVTKPEIMDFKFGCDLWILMCKVKKIMDCYFNKLVIDYGIHVISAFWFVNQYYDILYFTL